MSLVGPRPEQPAVVERLERDVPFYQRRHLIRPGITGWAQIRCGYARSESGSMWKHCHDLYYLKHRSIRIDLWILAGECETRSAWRGATDRGDHEIEGTGPDRSYADPCRRECGSGGRRRQLSGLTHMIPMPPISVETVRDERAFAGLAGEWDGACRDDAAPEPVPVSRLAARVVAPLRARRDASGARCAPRGNGWSARFRC